MRRSNRSVISRTFFALLPLVSFAAAQALAAEVELVGVANLPGTASDLSGLHGTMEGGTPENRIGGISAIDWKDGDHYLIVSDRGPLDGGTGYRCRFHEIELKRNQNAGDVRRPGSATARVTATTLLTDEAGHSLVGATKAFNATDEAKGLRFDPEGLRRAKDGHIFISDEYGPYVYEFSADGKRLRDLKTPARFHIKHPSADPAEEAAHNESGRQPNAGMEALAILPSGKLLGGMQRPLIQDSAPAKKPGGKRQGVNNRLLSIDPASGEMHEYVYVLDKPSYGVSEILAIDEQRFLVLERDGEAGEQAACKKIYEIDLAGATDVSRQEKLPAGELPSDIRPAKKSLLVDLLEPRFGLKGRDCPEKMEGLAFGPDLPDGRRLLVVAIDNDFKAELPILFYLFAVKGL